MRFIHVLICLTIEKNTLRHDTDYNKMAVRVSFVVIKAQHGVSARKSVQTHHTCKEKKRSLDRNLFLDLIILLVQPTS